MRAEQNRWRGGWLLIVLLLLLVLLAAAVVAPGLGRQRPQTARRGAELRQYGRGRQGIAVRV
jgi:hypothetical protein